MDTFIAIYSLESPHFEHQDVDGRDVGVVEHHGVRPLHRLDQEPAEAGIKVLRNIYSIEIDYLRQLVYFIELIIKKFSS